MTGTLNHSALLEALKAWKAEWLLWDSEDPKCDPLALAAGIRAYLAALPSEIRVIEAEDINRLRDTLCEVAGDINILKQLLEERFPKREYRREWRDYPAEKPFQIDPYTLVSHSMLFLTESGNESHIRLGYYDFKDGGFYESGVEGAPYHYLVTRYFPIPYPKTKTVNSIEDEGNK